jgi:iron complex outermembrane receptor protein
MLRNHKTLQQELHLDQGLIFLRSIFYHIKVKDRVLFSGEVGFDGDDTTTNPVEKYYLLTILLVCFINAVNTITKGVDVVLNYKI